ncbi:MAG: PSD1 domain-containing protein [Acidobacteria bacterium]|nr:PSD1 domain-containing protein [Acidobacteriota bacterium]
MIRTALLTLTVTTCALAQDAIGVFARHCLGCHGASQMSGLDMRTREGMLRGGGRGPAMVPGKAAESLLYKAIRRDGELKMPPGKPVLSAADVTAIAQWIDSGAPWNEKALQTQSTWWSFRPVQRPDGNHTIDSFLGRALRAQGLTDAPPADRRTLIRRLSYDLHGLPPTPEEVGAFVANKDPQAYPKLIDRLLASPRYGERWGRHWLDVVRYADTGGFETDVLLANAWRYRDYVIRSFNNDKPYNVFVQEQIAADEIWPDNLDLDGAYELPKSKLDNLEKRIGTSLYTLGALPVENTFFGDQYRSEWQADALETTSAAFLGLTMGCARCHDHKFDPLSQRDYYRLSAVFAGSEDREVPIVSQMAIFEFTRYQTRWVMADQLKAKLARLGGKNAKFDLTPSERDERESLLRQIGEAYVRAPAPVAKANLLMHTAPVPDTHVLQRGDWKQKGEKVRPGFPAALGEAAEIVEPETSWFIPRRRKALAEWLTSPQHPLTARVMVNRVWQGHFGRGLVATSNDFGRQGDPPTHPELLDWLAAEFMRNNWSVKSLHRQILLSDAYQRSSAALAANMEKDPENRYLWRVSRRRLEGEAIRDAVLAANGSLNTKMYGQPVVPPLSREEADGMRDMSQWPITSDSSEHNRRSVYLFVKRSFQNPMLEIFDAPDTSASCPRRDSSTIAPQSLALMNSEYMQLQAERFAERLKKEAASGTAAQVDRAWRLALSRAPSADEARRAAAYADRAGLARLCLLLFNMSEFLYVD